MTETQENDNDVYKNLTSTNQRLMREMEEFLSSVDKSFDQNVENSSAKIPQTRSTPLNLRQRQSQVCSNISGSEDNNITTGDSRINAPAQFKYYNDPGYLGQDQDHSYEDDSVIAMAKRLDEASIISDPSLICGTREQSHLIENQHKRDSMRSKDVKENTRLSQASRYDRHRRKSSTSSKSNVTKTAPVKERVAKGTNEKPVKTRSRSKDLKNKYKSSYDENDQQSIPLSKAKLSKQRRRKSSRSRGEMRSCDEESALNSGRKVGHVRTKAEYGHLKRPSNASFQQVSDRDTMAGFSQDSEEDGESSDQTEFFYDSADEYENDLPAVGSSVADAVKDLNNERGIKRVMNLFGKKNRGVDDLWSVTTQR